MAHAKSVTHRSAKLLINRHGDDAVIEAALMADKMLEAGDLESYPPSD